MTDYTIEEFCDKHGACHDGRRWALENCESVRDAWERLPHNFLLWAATRHGVLSDKELRLFAVFCARQVQHLTKDPRLIAAIDVAERFAHGEASYEDLDAASAAAWAARDAASAAWAAASDTARAARAARDAAWAALDAARAALDAASAAWAAASDTARAARAARDAASDAQSEWLRKNTIPNFTDAEKTND